MYSAFRRLTLAALFSSAGLAQSATLRVCADPNNLPFSNEQGQGFENKMAELIAANLNAKLEYAWWSERKLFAKKSLNAGACDVVMGVPTGMPDILTTEPYYRSTYVFVWRKDRKLQISSLTDPQLARLSIGMHVVGDDFAPPSVVLARQGITHNIVGYSLFGKFGEPNPPRKLIDAVENGDIDIAIIWGPFAGFFAQDEKFPLVVVPVSPSTFRGVPFSYGISAAVRAGNEVLKAELDRILSEHCAEVQQILARYAVPEVKP